jgi:hypothetical protein
MIIHGSNISTDSSVFIFSLHVQKIVYLFFIPYTYPHRCTYFDQIWLVSDILKRACGPIQAKLFPHYFVCKKGTGIMTTMGS